LNLLDPKRSFYSLKKKKVEEWIRNATSEIQDENGNQIGLLEGRGIFKKQVSMIDSDGNTILTLKKNWQ